MPRVSLDTQILLWALRNPQDEREECSRTKTLFLLDELEKQKADVVISSIAVAELLGLMPSSQRMTLLATLDSLFQIIPFDSMAAFEFTRLPRHEGNRDKNKSDRMIVATALAAKCSVIYSEDQDVHDIGQEFIEVRRLPSVPPVQLSLMDKSQE